MPSQLDLCSFEFGWLIGILEGEGTFKYNKATQSIAVGMKDEDTINRVASLFERILRKPINIREQMPAKDHHSLMFYVDLSGERARTMMRLVVRHMSYRRRQQIWRCLNKYNMPSEAKAKPDLMKLIFGEMEA